MYIQCQKCDIHATDNNMTFDCRTASLALETHGVGSVICVCEERKISPNQHKTLCSANSREQIQGNNERSKRKYQNSDKWRDAVTAQGRQL
jgi:hypothetical protein